MGNESDCGNAKEAGKRTIWLAMVGVAIAVALILIILSFAIPERELTLAQHVAQYHQHIQAQPHRPERTPIVVNLNDTIERASRGLLGGDVRSSVPEELVPDISEKYGDGNYGYEELLRWFPILDRALIDAGLSPSTGSVSKSKNRIRFGMRTEARLKLARQLMREIGVPDGAVVFVLSDPQLLSRPRGEH